MRYACKMFTFSSVAVLCAIVVPPIFAINCTDGEFETPFLLYPNGKKDYYFRKDVDTVDDASTYCKERGMRLLSISSKEENIWLQKQIICRELEQFSFWTTGSRLADGKSWEWTPKGLPINYTNWAAGSPTPPGSGKDCIEITVVEKNLVWKDESCKKQQYFICEKLLP